MLLWKALDLLKICCKRRLNQCNHISLLQMELIAESCHLYSFVTSVCLVVYLLMQGVGPQLDYYAYGAPEQSWPPLGGFCEQYQAVS